VIRGVLILLLCQLLGEVVAQSAGIPVPGGVVGMLILFVGLILRRGVPDYLEQSTQLILKPLTLFVSKEGMTSYFQWLKSEYGFSEKNVRPYNFNPQPFIANPKSAMQGYVTSEPFAVEKAAGFKPNVILLADAGFNTYSTLIETRRDLVEKKADLVQRFVDASMIGWYNYIYGDNSAGNAMIKKLNPEMTDELLAYSVAKMKEYGIVDSGDSLKNGIGAMSDERYTSFFDKMVKAGVVKGDLDFRKSYTLRFVNKGVGVELRPAKP